MLRRIVVLAALSLTLIASAQERIKDVIYMKSGGAAFTMDVFKPKTANGAAIVFLVSGGWFSSHEAINPEMAAGFNAAGFTVFEVVHGSQPKYTIPEIMKQITRAVRFVHSVSATYGVDPNRLGLCGASAGGHLSLMTAGKADAGDPSSKDPVEQQPSTVATVGIFFPPTDFLNYGKAGAPVVISDPKFMIFKPAFGIPANATTDQINTIAHDASPIYTITPKFPPTLIIHGDNDQLVPLQQSESMRDALTKAGVTAELFVVKGGGHDAVTVNGGIARLIAWFTEKLKK